MNKLTYFFILLVSTISVLCAGDVSVKLSRNIVSINDSFSVSFSTKKKIQGQPDFSPLKNDFDILSNSQCYNTSIINGKVTQETRWDLLLISKKEGELVIPSIQFENYRSEPQTIKVSHSSSNSNDESIFLETVVQPKDSIYEQSLLVYTLRLYYSINIAQGSLSEVKLNDPDAMIEKMGDDLEYEHRHKNGRLYKVFERKYAIQPQHKGELIINPVIFTGQLFISDNSFFGTQTQMKRIISKEEKLNVKPCPASFTENKWFAAKDVRITEEWSQDPNKMTLGVPITWTLIIKAKECLANQIPEISINLPADLKHYLDKPEISNQFTADSIEGVKKISIALIATKPGEFIIPKINIAWWNLDKDKVQFTELQERTIQIAPDNIAMNLPEVNDASNNPVPEIISEKSQTTESFSLWIWALIGFNIILLFGILVFAYFKLISKRLKSDSIRKIKKRLKEACKSGDPKTTEECLLAWADIIYPEQKPLNIKKLKHLLSIDFQDAINDLHRALYGQNETWNGELFWEKFCKLKSPKNARKGQPNAAGEILRELY